MLNPQPDHRWDALMIAAILVTLAAAIPGPAQTFTTLHAFDNTDGATPNAGLVQGLSGALYGPTELGGLFSGTCKGNGCGTLFKITPGGAFTTLQDLNSTDGTEPIAGMVQAADANLYGTAGGGVNGQGIVFKLTLSGTETVLYNFCPIFGCPDGAFPDGTLIQGSDGNLYGTTYSGGSPGNGTVFKMTLQGTLTTLHSFDVTDGQEPQAGLLQASDGNFYGTTYSGGANDTCATLGCGTVFRVTPSGAFTSLHSFDSADGANPYAGVIQASDGNFYGTTEYGGANSAGSVFKMTPDGTLTTLYVFCSQSHCIDGQFPQGGLVQATDGNLYGVTAGGGGSDMCSSGCGTIFKITLSGTLTTLHRFQFIDGAYPYPALTQDTNGRFYGTTLYGPNSSCALGCGSVFSLSVGLGPFVETLPTAGNVGKSVIILGTKLTGTTSVTFNGTPASFTIESPTAIKTTVPTGATTAPVQLVTPSGTLTSNVNFQVLP